MGRDGFLLDKLGKSALLQLKEQGVDIGNRLEKFGVPPDADQPGRHKFGISVAADRTVDGIRFDSKLEARAYIWLRDRGIPHTRQDVIELQPKFSVRGKNYRRITYKTDFAFAPLVQGGFILHVDMKGVETEAFKLRLKMALYQGHDVVAVKTVTGLEELLRHRGYF